MTGGKLIPRWMLGAEWMALVLLVIATQALFPWQEAVRSTVAFAVAYAVPRYAYRRSNLATTAGSTVLLAVAVWTITISIGYIYNSTIRNGASFQMPMLFNDSAKYYDWALNHYDGSVVEPKITFWGYPLFIVGLWKVLGVNIIWPVASNSLISLLTVVLTGRLAAVVCPARKQAATTLGMAFVSVQGYFISQGAQMMKESWIYLSMTLMALSLLMTMRASTQRQFTKSVLLYALGCFILAAVRAKYINFMFIGLAMMALANGFRNWRHTGLLFIITLICWFLGMSMTLNYTVEQQVNNVTGNGGMDSLFSLHPTYYRLLGDYFHYPVWKKLFCLPLTCGVQWVIPFPWMSPSSPIGVVGLSQRFQLGWYVLSSIVIYFYLFQSWRHGWQWAAWSWIPMMCLVGIAYMTAGTVSRYILCFQPWLMSLAAFAVLRCGKQRSFLVFTAGYLLVTAIVLFWCYQVMH